MRLGVYQVMTWNTQGFEQQLLTKTEAQWPQLHMNIYLSFILSKQLHVFIYFQDELLPYIATMYLSVFAV